MAVDSDATILAATNTSIRTPSTPSSVTRLGVAANIDQLTNSKVSRADRPWTPKGAWDASTNLLPNNGDTTVLQNYTYENGNHVSTSMIDFFGDVVRPYATLRALVDNPGSDLTDRSKWRLTY